jgi:hypothetical protein
MSKGLGHTQRRILEVLEERRASEPEDGAEPFVWTDVDTLAWHISGRDEKEPYVTRSEVESTRRAVRTLERRGLVETWHGQRRKVGGARRLCARLALSDEQRALRDERLCAYAAELVQRGIDPSFVRDLLIP